MKIRKPFVMGGMLLVAALLFLSMFISSGDGEADNILACRG